MFRIYAENPQSRLLKQAAEMLQKGGVIAYPTDSGYALGCALDNKKGVDRIREIRKLPNTHNFTLVCRNLSEISYYAKIDNAIFRLLKSNTPGAYTFIFFATKEVPKRLQHEKRKTIGFRIPDNVITLALLAELGAPLMSVSLLIPDAESPIACAEDIYANLAGKIDLILDGGFCGHIPTTVVDFTINTDGSPKIARLGKAEAAPFLLNNTQNKNSFYKIYSKLLTSS